MYGTGEIMERATQEMREVLSQKTEEDGGEQWDPDAWEAEVVRFTRQREVTLKHAERAAGFVEREGWKAIGGCQDQCGFRHGKHG